ncbi:putative integral membrane protein [Pseudomonas laurylsulfativorans]|uniref:lipopolysaccharide assembly protein LapA domain-containing protein n=1 Tax=Pseudomonas laurylsulfativorans TaxID=1943631 RepID=UPI00209D8FCE|nr:LapA family protein [Pseudomonas laurylsulfativorans]MCP1417743.1 putative integral membrane protein [Pseudomonas laurylsulfativorans]
MRFAIIGLILLVAVACLLFVLENQQLVVVSFFGFSSPQLQISIVGVVAFLAGMILGGLMVAVYALRSRRGVRQVSH